jgi:signal transduction histidine kinase
VNRAGANLLDRPMDDLIGRRASEVGLAEYIAGPAPRTFDRVFPGGRGRWELRRSDFRQDGRPHRLVVLADLSRALREEELQAWQRLIRVLSHEINNSLTPIQSITRSVRRIIERDYAEGERSEEVQEGLRVVATRAESLGRLMSEYARLARLPKPVVQSVRIDELVRGVAGLEPRVTVRIMPRSVSFEDATLMADPAQLEQVLINLVRNAADASLETGGEVAIGWRVDGDTVQLMVEDDGHGIADPANLFVPFYTTKPHGTGIGLALSRQIAEAHGGAVTLENRENGKGCRATLSLPIDRAASSRNGERS